MKLASLEGCRDGRLIVVSTDLKSAVSAENIAKTLQTAVDNWDEVEAPLRELSKNLNDKKCNNIFDFDPSKCLAPLPRAYQWVDTASYVNHVELVRKARGAVLPEKYWIEPVVYQGGSDDFLRPHGQIPLPTDDMGIDFEGELAVILDDVPMLTNAEEALDNIKLFMLVNDVSLRNLIADELAKHFGFYQSKPSTGFSPVAVTPDEFGESWRDGRLHLPLICTYNGKLFGRANAGKDMVFHFGQLIEHLTKTRNLCAGTIVGSGTVSNKEGSEYGSPVSEGGCGYSCILEQRMVETMKYGESRTPFMSFGDQITIEMFNNDKESIFGAIYQTLTKLN